MLALADQRQPRVAPLSVGVLGRLTATLIALAAIGYFTLPAFAADALRLRGDVTARGDVLTLGDLVEGAGTDIAGKPLFRAPALGATGTIQSRRILDAVAALGVGPVETGGRVQIAVQRAARRVGAPEIEAALKRALETGQGLDPRVLSIRLDGETPTLLAPVDLNGAAAALDVVYEPRSRRVSGLISLGERQASLRVSGLVVEMREVAVLARAVKSGEPITSADVTLERRPREGSPPDAQGNLSAIAGEVAQRTLAAGAVLRMSDTAPPELVGRGEAVNIVYETPGVSLSMRGQANEAGRLGSTVSVLNVASKKTLQAVVVGAARVSVGPTGPQRQASAALPAPIR
ncbi:flagellar basal body P-ring formation chaperone FlgA [Methylobacterium durans]|uniref:flagellar basal body P-ring formation chaperone FlgA n=1 Tax=Methylobacterium durans TaxID=2202825 RepID=UPI002AFFCA8F|nr:flagellar basal body P-ring formation chaperone FlgA [Methylobacterium durans]MEA1832968.1 flagellar basal body P-ring formation chaperone FlgA [Methylobacterium durans]